MNLRMRMSFAALSLCVLTAGCANLNSIYRDEDVDHDSKVLLIDAKQRAILTTMRPVKVKADHSGYVESYRAFCAEPSPDVFTVLSQAANGSASFGQSADSINAAAQLAISSAESGATISRTQTINMLREMMYRTCERYMSGALDEMQFPIQAIRDQHVMVSILAIEQLTGAITPPTVTLISSGNADTGQATGDAIVRLDDSWKALQTANSDVDAKTSALAAVSKDTGKSTRTCDDLNAAFKKDPASLTADGDKTKEAACTDAQTQLEKAQTAQRSAQNRYDALKKVADSGNPASASSSGQANVTAAPADPNRAATVQAAANVVQEIVDRNFDQDEFELFCVRKMSDTSSKDPEQVKIAESCLNYMQARVDNQSAHLANDAAKLRFDAARLNAATAEVEGQTNAAFEKFWVKVATNDVLDAGALKKLIEVYLSPNAPGPPTPLRNKQPWLRRLNDLAAQTTKSGVKKAFSILLPIIKQELAQ